MSKDAQVCPSTTCRRGMTLAEVTYSSKHFLFANWEGQMCNQAYNCYN